MRIVLTAVGRRLAMAATKVTVLLSATVSFGLLWAPCALAQRAGLDADAVMQLRIALEQGGFTVNAGLISTVDWAGMFCSGERADAGYANKSPYLFIQVPESVDDPAPVENFKLRPDEAIVLIGPTPPPVKYFGLNAFLATRFYPDEPEGSQRKWLVATLGDAINNATIRTIGPTPFDTPVVIVATPDRGTDARIRAVLQRHGYPPALFNTMVLPSSMLKLGESDTADMLTLKMRIGMAEEGEAEVLDAYVRNAGRNVVVLRLTPKVPAIADPFPVPRLRVRGTGQTEMDLMEKVDQLRAGIIAANPGMYATDIPSVPVGYEGFDYIQRRTSPGADSRDNLFLAAGYIPQYGSNQRLTLAMDEFLVVYGVNHVATGKASYASVNVYASEFAKLSIGQVFHDRFPDTAAPYMDFGDPAVSLLYAVKASRDCGSEPNCIPLRVDACPVLELDDNTALGFFFRMYLEPATKAGAAMQEIVYDRAIKFSPRP
jgi:hypothetical protein